MKVQGEKLLMKGNEALAEAAVRAGCTRFFGYPITPQNELAAYMAKRLPKIKDGVFLQAESEVAAINMVLGAAASGVRAMTSSSSPGISLKTEGISYLAASDLPCLIVNIQRAGPGLGGIQPAQADYWQATRGLGHGGARVLVFAPNSIREMVDHVFDGFELAEKYRMPAMILSDGLLGQMMEPVIFPDRQPNISQKPWAADGHGGVRPRNVVNSLYLDSLELERQILRRENMYREIEANEARHGSYMLDDAKVAVVAYGAASRIAERAVDISRERGLKAGLIRPVTLFPFPAKAIADSLDGVEKLLAVELCSGQMVEDVRLAVNGRVPVGFFGRTGGVIPSPEEIYEALARLCKGECDEDGI